MTNPWSRRDVLAAGVGLAAGLSTGETMASARTRSPERGGASSDIPNASDAWLAFAPLDPRLSGKLGAGPAPLGEPIFTLPLRRVPLGAGGGRVRRIELLGCTGDPEALRSLRVDALRSIAGRVLRTTVLGADASGRVGAVCFTTAEPEALLSIHAQGAERTAKLSRRGIYAIAVSQRPGLFAARLLAAYPSGGGLVLDVLAGERPAPTPFLIARVS